jgi:hypothetical protein
MTDEPLFDLPEEDRPDPSDVAFMDQESASFNADAREFKAEFGFSHTCTCADDYAKGNLAETTHCFGRLCQEALDACRDLKEERDYLLKLVQKALTKGLNDTEAD